MQLHRRTDGTLDINCCFSSKLLALREAQVIGVHYLPAAL
jgi:hypothetical protein